MNEYDNDNDHHKMWVAAVWTTFWLSWIVLLFVYAVSEPQAHEPQPVFTEKVDTHFVPQPPEQYEGVPENFRMFFVPRTMVNEICEKTAAIGCSVRWPAYPKRPCLVFISENAGGLTWQTITHEYGHCNGWPANHPNERMP